MRRRRLLALLGIGGTSGCLRLASDDATTQRTTTRGPTSETETAPEPATTNDTATETTESTAEPTEESTTTEPAEPTLAEAPELDVRWDGPEHTAGLAVGDSDVYVDNSGLEALDRARGFRRWQPFPNDDVRHFTLDAGDLFVGTEDGRVVAVNTETRSRRWTYEGTDLDSRVRVGADAVVFGEERGDGGALVCLERESGAERWRVETDDGISDLSPPGSDVVVFGTTGRANIRARDLGGGERRWFSSESHTAMAPLVADGTAYVPTAFEVLAFDVASGDVVWRYRLPEAGERFSGDAVERPPRLHDGVLLLPVERGGLAAVNATTGRGEWFYEVSGSKSATVALDGSDAWFADRRGVHRVGMGSGDGRRIGRYGTDAGSVEGLMADGDALFLSTTFGGVDAFDIVA
jgi:outer membrane protein assembly factor BamB